MAVNSLSDLKHKLERVQVKIISFNGLTLETELGTYTLGPDMLMLDWVVVTKKELNALIKSRGGKDIDD